MSINFPSSPSNGNTYGYNGIVWSWNGYAWDKLGITGAGTPGNTGATGPAGPTGATGPVDPYVSFWNGSTGVVTFSNYVSSFNGATGAITFTFNGATGPVGISAGNQISITTTGNTYTINVLEGKGSGLDTDLIHGISGERFIENLQTGLLYGGVLSINAGNTATFDITGGRGIILTPNASTGAYPAPTITPVSWNTTTGITLPISTTDITYISINSSGSVVKSDTGFTNTTYETQIPIGAMIHPTRSYISFAKNYPHVAYGQAAQMDPFVRAFGPLKLSGHEISGYDATLQLSRSSGTAYALGRNWINDPNSPNIVTDTNALPVSVIYRQYRGITSGTWTTVINSAVDPTKYDNGTGTLATVSGGLYTIQRVFFYPSEPTTLLVYYGRATYNSIDAAKTAIPFESFSEAADTADSAIFCAYLIVKSNISNFSQTSDYSIVQAGLFRSTANVGGGGVAVANLDDLSDVTITSATNNDLLRYNSGTSAWVNTAITSLPLVSSFNGLSGAVTGVTTSVANTFTALQTFNTGISAAGATFNGDLYVGNIISNDPNPTYPLYINNKGTSQTYIGDVDGNGQSTYMFVNDDAAEITLTAPGNAIYLNSPYVEVNGNLTVVAGDQDSQVPVKINSVGSSIQNALEILDTNQPVPAQQKRITVSASGDMVIKGSLEVDTTLTLPNGQGITCAVTTFNGLTGDVKATSNARSWFL
jgi:hypothetical protein